jgi:hypothetical protein
MISNGLAADYAPELRAGSGFDDEKLRSIFGADGERAHLSNLGPISTIAVERALAFVEGSGVAEMVERWDREDRAVISGKHANAGRRSDLTIKQVLTLMFIHLLDGRGLVVIQVAEMAATRISDCDLFELGLSPDLVRSTGW